GGRHRVLVGAGALVGGQVALPGGVANTEANGLAVVAELDAVERQLLRRVVLAGGLRECGGEPLVVEGGLTTARLGIDQDELAGAAGQVVAIPEAAVAGKPVRRDLGLVDAAARLAGLGRALVRFAEFLRCGDVLLRLGRPLTAGRAARQEQGG